MVLLVSRAKEHLSDVYRHLTNYSINKAAENFQENQRVQADNYGHKWSISALNRHLRCVGVNVKETLDSKAFSKRASSCFKSYLLCSVRMWSRIMDIIVKTLLAVEQLGEESQHLSAQACHQRCNQRDMSS